MMTFDFKQVDVFTKVPYRGNPVAVVIGAQDLDTETMQQIAAWTNLSETTFLLPPTRTDADYLLRIFTPKQELPFAGHPTIGSAHAALESEFVKPTAGKLVQECGAGLVPLRIDASGDRRSIHAKAPPAKIQSLDGETVAALQSALGLKSNWRIDPMLVDVGPVWLTAYVGDGSDVHELTPDFVQIAELSSRCQMTGITVFGIDAQGSVPVQVRSFAPLHGIPEDPVCGSGNACVGAFLANSGMLAEVGKSYIANQGTEVGRNGFVTVTVDPSEMIVEIGGNAVTCIDGTISA